MRLGSWSIESRIGDRTGFILTYTYLDGRMVRCWQVPESRWEYPYAFVAAVRAIRKERKRWH